MNNKYKAISMFAGIGGICKGFIEAGVDVIWANDIDKYACQTYRYNFGSEYLVEKSIMDVKVDELPSSVDILSSGFPCQAFSIAGYRKGFEDERGNLFFETLRFIKEKQPRAFLLENVKNLVSHDKGKTFNIIKQSLIEEGYFIKSNVLNALNYGNIPQNRERIYIVGFRSEKERDEFQWPPEIPLTKTIHDIININEKKDDKYYYTEKSQYYDMLREAVTKQDTVYQLRRIYVRENRSNVCPTLTANMGTGGHNVPIILDNFGIRKLTPEECFKFQGYDDIEFDPNMSNTHLYKQAGNSVVIPVIKKIAENMVSVMKRFDILKSNNEDEDKEITELKDCC